MPLVEIVHQPFSPSNVVPKTVVGPTSSMRGIVVTPSGQQNWDASQLGYVATHTFVGRTEISLGFIGRAQTKPLSAKTDGKPLALSPISNRLRAKTIKTDLMLRHVPLLRWTPTATATRKGKS